ncbi:MAG: redoxin domain-containing protein [Anaerolineales bacterium]|nr:redoxin domain-containing protein [Anaerolineales bacterium]
MTDTDGTAFHLAEALEAGQSLILVFYPGWFQCRWCLEVLRELEVHRVGLEANGYGVIAVAAGPLSQAAVSRQEAGVEYAILADSDAAVTRLYGVPRLVPGRPKHRAAPMQIFIIERDGQITWSGSAVKVDWAALEQWLNCGRLACLVP